jgi:hypothetical protein
MNHNILLIVLKILEQPNINLNLTFNNSTPLIETIKRGKTLLAFKILENKPPTDITIKDNNGKTAYDYATEKNNKLILHRLSQINKLITI